jgi:hypothetical protein
MAFMFSHYPDCPPRATPEEQRKWWEGFRKQHNREIREFNQYTKRLNRYLLILPWMWGRRQEPLPLVPSYDKVMAKYKAQK